MATSSIIINLTKFQMQFTQHTTHTRTYTDYQRTLPLATHKACRLHQFSLWGSARSYFWQNYICNYLQHGRSTHSPSSITVSHLFMTLIKSGIVTACWRVWHFSPQVVDAAAQTWLTLSLRTKDVNLMVTHGMTRKHNTGQRKQAPGILGGLLNISSIISICGN